MGAFREFQMNHQPSQVVADEKSLGDEKLYPPKRFETGKQRRQIVNIECCVDCVSHSWLTRHDEDKYSSCFNEGKLDLSKDQYVRILSITILLLTFLLSLPPSLST